MIKDNNLNNFIWKNQRVLGVDGNYIQTEKKLMDMNYAELINCYGHCKIMLFNKDSKDPGRYLVLEIIEDQKNKCGVELFLRHVEQVNELNRFNISTFIGNFMDVNKEAIKYHKVTIENVFSSIPSQFEKLPLQLILDGCLDKLGTLIKKHITRKFIFKQGIWLTPSEAKELVEYDSNGVLKNRLELIKERLHIRDIEKLYINSKGLNYTQIRAMLNIKADVKYKDLTTVQLETLRYRILFDLENSVKFHINLWETKMEELEQVAEFKGLKL